MSDIKGKKYGTLTVAKFSHLNSSRHAVWICKCDCGHERIAESRLLRNKSIKTCKKCSIKNRNGKTNPSWQGYEDISLSLFNSIKRDAIRRGLEFSITIEFLWELFKSQNGKCALSNESLNFRTKVKSSDGTASLDRIDSSKGYTIDNVQWVHKDVNVMMWDLSMERFFDLIKKIYIHKEI